jgi:hypothetical protein
MGVGGTTGGTVGERVPAELGFVTIELLRETPVTERDGLTEPVSGCGILDVLAKRPSPPKSAGKRLRMVCARWEA